MTPLFVFKRVNAFQGEGVPPGGYMPSSSAVSASAAGSAWM